MAFILFEVIALALAIFVRKDRPVFLIACGIGLIFGKQATLFQQDIALCVMGVAFVVAALRLTFWSTKGGRA